MLIDRRTFLISLATVPPALTWPGWILASGDPSNQFAEVSRIITGANNLTPGVAARIEALLIERNPDFAKRLLALHQALTTEATREDALSGLSEDDLTTALVIAKPWYVGYVGTPSGRVLEDDAAFATFMEMQAYPKTGGIIPPQSYPPGPAGWWQEVPDGVDASDLPEDVTSWEYQPLQNYRIAAPDPVWRAYAAGEYDTIEAARAALGSEG